MNLFLGTRVLTDAREDHLTEFFAAALEMSDRTRRAYFGLVVAQFAEARGWGRCEISTVETQPCYDDASCRPDMLLTLSNGKKIGCEHKLNAVETPGPGDDERGQLERYLDLPIDGLVYVRASWSPPQHHILDHPKYIRPVDREHFLWRDFYPLFESATDPFLRWLKEGFERLGFTPPHPQVDIETEAGKRNFAKLWGKTRSSAHRLGWYSSAGSIFELYLEYNEDSTASCVFIQPVSGAFRFRVTPKQGQQEVCFASLVRACDGYPHPLEHSVKLVRRKEGKVAVYDVIAPASTVLGHGTRPTAETEDRLREFVEHLLRAIQVERPVSPDRAAPKRHG